jgi:hypothetical protein
MFGCYRRDDAADPETFVAAVTLVLSHYSSQVVEGVTDPFSGLPGRKKENGYSGLPDVADVKEACENEASRLARMAHYAAMPRANHPRLRPPPAGPGAWATISVPTTAPQFEGFKKRTESADVREWRRDRDGSLWVSYSWFDTGSNSGRIRQGRALFQTRAAAQGAKQPNETNDPSQSAEAGEEIVNLVEEAA